MINDNRRAAFHTLGCKVNQYETAGMIEMFRNSGYEIVGEQEFADVYVINTCTVTAMADRKSRQYIRRMKKLNPDAIVAVTGCYVQISPEEVEAIDGVDIIAGMNEKHRIIDYVEGMRKEQAPAVDEFVEMGPVTSAENRTRAYIKVQEGCNRFCSYCVIPYARGPVRSRPLDNIVEEAKALIAAGYKELVLTGINTALYGMEEDPDSFGLEPVIAAVNELEGDFRIRLSSLEPAVVNAEYVKKLFSYDRLCHHLHMSAQSGSDSVLAAMNRPYDSGDYYDLVNELFEFDDCYGISTDIIVGFPGETEADFRDSCELVKECSFCRTHIFKYSRRPKTKAAEMKNQVSPQVKNRRSDELETAAKAAMTGFFEINLAAAAEGRTERVLLEEVQGDYITGFTGNYIRAYIPLDKELKPNTFVTVRLTGLYRDGMTAEIVI
ncbi:MAG: tRNA (N(6)-L-threonylcarbamoyladenosine(37)-C(2))-methylthiotransferase MtaB [Clostridia bacterium]|nr:tRNA (N(6)-L-threonylcarbamoyladenosine(37)-C(2))-methylthiotransferase MtaB [Clostridia bacterium]